MFRTAALACLLALAPTLAEEPLRLDFLELDVPQGWKTSVTSSGLPKGMKAFKTVEFMSLDTPGFFLIVSAATFDAETLEEEQNEGHERRPGLAALGLVMPLMSKVADKLDGKQALNRVLVNFDVLALAGQLAPAARATVHYKGSFMSTRGAILLQDDGRAMFAVVGSNGREGALGPQRQELVRAYAMLDSARFADLKEPVAEDCELQQVVLGPLTLELPGSWTVEDHPPPTPGGALKRVVSDSTPPAVLLLGLGRADEEMRAQDPMQTLDQHHKGVIGAIEFERSRAVYDWDRLSVAGRDLPAVRCLLPYSTSASHALHNAAFVYADHGLSFTVVGDVTPGKPSTSESYQQAMLAIYRALHEAKLAAK